MVFVNVDVVWQDVESITAVIGATQRRARGSLPQGP
jgi:hypothetical protein